MRERNIMITNLRTKVKFYIKNKAFYSNLFKHNGDMYFCHHGAEYSYTGKDLTFRSVSAKGQEVIEIKITDWHRRELK